MDFEKLKSKLHPSAIKKNAKGFDYLEAWYAIETANDIFGFDGWSYDVVSLDACTEPTTNANGNYVVSYRAIVRLSVGGVIRTDVGFGSGISRSIHDAHEGATKEAVTDALKRALRTFGNRFGNCLYDKEKNGVGVEPTATIEEAMQWIEDCETDVMLNQVWKDIVGSGLGGVDELKQAGAAKRQQLKQGE